MPPAYAELLLTMQIIWRYKKKHVVSTTQDENQEALWITSMRKEADPNFGLWSNIGISYSGWEFHCSLTRQPWELNNEPQSLFIEFLKHGHSWELWAVYRTLSELTRSHIIPMWKEMVTSRPKAPSWSAGTLAWESDQRAAWAFYLP